MALIVIFSTSFGALFTKIVHYSCEVLRAYSASEVKDDEFPNLRDIKKYQSISGLDLDGFLDLTLLQIAALSENLYKREDLYEEMVICIQNQIDTLTNGV